MSGVKPKGNPFGKLLPARYVVAVLGCIGLAIVYGLNVNLSVAIVSMVNHTATRIGNFETNQTVLTLPENYTNDECSDNSYNTSKTEATHEDGPFEWSRPLQGAILSSYFWGYLISQMPGARVAELFSSKWTMFFAVAVNVLCTLLTPPMAKMHHYGLIAMRIIEGIGGGVTFPAMHVLLAHWAPPTERSVMSSVCYAGTALGTVISMLLSGIIAGTVSWEGVFYIQGAASIIWLILWSCLISDTPSSQTLISQEERNYIESSLKTNQGKREKQSPVPWKSVFTSSPFWAILITHTLSGWGWYMVLIELPYYMKSALKYNINENATVIALPFFTLWLFSIILSKILDSMREKQFISTTTARKIGTGFASAVPMVCFIIICYVGCQRGLVVFLMTLSITCCGGAFCGFMTNHIDIAPNFAGTLMAITNTASTLPGIFVPVFVGELTKTDAGVNSWRIIFWVTVAFYLIEFIIYTIFGSGEEQKWNHCEFDLTEAQPLKTPATVEKQKQFNFENNSISTTR